MIFVTVGTHEQPFNRLVKKVDDLVAKEILKKRLLYRLALVHINQVIVMSIK